jgi:hypothetical protein
MDLEEISLEGGYELDMCGWVEASRWLITN